MTYAQMVWLVSLFQIVNQLNKIPVCAIKFTWSPKAKSSVSEYAPQSECGVPA